jgi:hypothetical protein
MLGFINKIYVLIIFVSSFILCFFFFFFATCTVSHVCREADKVAELDSERG